MGDMQRPPGEEVLWKQAISHGTAYDALASTFATQPTSVKGKRIDIEYANKACMQLVTDGKLGEQNDFTGVHRAIHLWIKL